MSVSFAEMHAVTCRRCGAEVDLLTWRAVDLIERPDLREPLAEGLLDGGCDRCGARHRRDNSLLVTRMHSCAPVILAAAGHIAVRPDLAVSTDSALLERVKRAIAGTGQDVPGPVLVVSYDVLRVAAARDLGRDVADPKRAIRAIRTLSPGTAKRYRNFLEDIVGSGRDRRIEEALEALWHVEDLSQLRSLVARLPELVSPDAIARTTSWRDDATDEEERAVAAARLELLVSLASHDLQGGWARWRRFAQSLADDSLEPRARAHVEAFDEAHGRADWASAAAHAEELLELGDQMSEPRLVAMASDRLATALHEQGGAGRVDRMRRAISALERALAIAAEDPEAPIDVPRSKVNLAAIVAARPDGDPTANQARAGALLREVLATTSIDDDPHTWATAHTNLGLSLLEGAPVDRSPDSDGTEEDAAAGEALHHFAQALRWRTRERDPGDWAYTQVNAGLAHHRRHSGDRTTALETAISHYDAAEDGFRRAGLPLLVARAVQNRSDARLELAGRVDETRGAQLLDSALRDAELSVSVSASGVGDPAQHGRALRHLATVAGRRGDDDSALNHLAAAVVILERGGSPRVLRDAARDLGERRTARDDWSGAADALCISCQAAADAIDARGGVRGRFDEIRAAENLSRWAAYANARAGRPERAVELLELGRGRELAAWLGRDRADLERVRHLDPELAARFEELRDARRLADATERDLTRGGVDLVSVAEIVEQLDRVVTAIRRLPGLVGFLQRPTFADIASAAAPHEIVAMPVTTPHGSLVLLLRSNPSGSVEVLELPELTSTAIVQRLIVPDERTAQATGYLISQAETRPDLDERIGQLGALLGPEMLRPICDAIRGASATTVTLVPIGLLGLVPLHALTWPEEGRATCLLEHADVLFAPSVFARAISRTRAAIRRGPGKMVAVGGPLPSQSPLEFAAREARASADALGFDSTVLLCGHDATIDALIAALPGASHVHLACHGHDAFGAPEALDAGLLLAADQELTAARLLAEVPLEARLVVASACQTGVIAGYGEADESLALSTVLLGAGAAGVVATLWEIQDLATSLLMARFYELLTEEGAPEPARALRLAQLWLRDLEAAEAVAEVARRPSLRSLSAQVELSRGDRPFAAPSLWAPFTLNGA